MRLNVFAKREKESPVCERSERGKEGKRERENERKRAHIFPSLFDIHMASALLFVATVYRMDGWIHKSNGCGLFFFFVSLFPCFLRLIMHRGTLQRTEERDRKGMIIPSPLLAQVANNALLHAPSRVNWGMGG